MVIICLLGETQSRRLQSLTLLSIECRFNFVTEGIMVTVVGGLGILLHLMAIYTMARGVTGSSSISGGSRKHFFSLSTRLLAPIDIIFLILGQLYTHLCHRKCSKQNEQVQRWV